MYIKVYLLLLIPLRLFCVNDFLQPQAVVRKTNEFDKAVFLIQATLLCFRTLCTNLGTV